jgi:hypothetical protein
VVFQVCVFSELNTILKNLILHLLPALPLTFCGYFIIRSEPFHTAQIFHLAIFGCLQTLRKILGVDRVP